MAVEVTLDSPLATQLQNAIQSKVAEAGWSGVDDTGLSEYVVLMLVNGKNQEQVTTELAQDLLDLQVNDPVVNNFSQWLFEHLDQMSKAQSQTDSANAQMDSGGQEQEMQNTADAPGEQDDALQSNTIPTGPKSMRENPMRGGKRGGSLASRVTPRAPETAMHRIKGTASRINSHARDSPRGSAGRGGRGNMRSNVAPGRMNNAMQNQLDALSGQQMMDPAQMFAFQHYMMSQFMTPEQQQAYMATVGGAMPQMPQAGGFGHGYRANGHIKRSNGDSDAMDVTGSKENGGMDPTTTMCRYNLFCTKPDCVFVHQSPAAPSDTTVDMNDTCQFGAMCTNKKCAGRHPSPAKRMEQSQPSAAPMCRFWPNCTNPHCTFMHPSTPMCRNGGDCTMPNCKFAHPTIDCKFNPCLNPHCNFKHSPGQKRGKFQDKVWINPEHNEERTSERKFTDESVPQETILPGSGGDGGGGEANGHALGDGQSAAMDDAEIAL